MRGANLTAVLLLAAAIIIAAALAWWPWRHALDRPVARVAVVARGVAVWALLLLLLDPGIRGSIGRGRPLVLLDNSVSMHATGAQADSAARLAATLGEVVPFGELPGGLPGGRTALAEVLGTAIGAGRPIVVVSDGEVADAAAISADLLAQATVRLLPRPTGPDVALTDARLPSRLATGDTLRVEVTLRATGGWSDTVRIEVRDGNRVLMSGTGRFAAPDGRALVRMRAALPRDVSGARRLEIQRVGTADAEPLNDRRIRELVVTPSPGIVVLAERPDFDARFLYSTIAAVTESPVRGFVQLQAGSWRRMDDLRPVTTQEVVAAARQADLLAVRGDTTPYRGLGRARLLWPAGGVAGDWYVMPSGASPLSGALSGIEGDSLPSLPEVAAVPAGDWVALVARQARRGAEVPVVAGRVDGGRVVVIGATGLHRWGFRGGMSEQAWRGLLGAATAWLLASPATAGARVQPIEAVVQQGRQLRFRGAPHAAPLAIAFASPSGGFTDTLRFDGDGIALAALPVGRWGWQTADGGAGTVEVETYADELVPTPPTLVAREAAVLPSPMRRSMREVWPLFLLAVLGLLTEWLIRRRLGMR